MSGVTPSALDSGPNTVSLRRAARAPKANSPAGWQVGLEFVIIVVIPLSIPNLALLLSRGHVTIAELSFGFVALAVATITKTVANPTPAWFVATVVAVPLTVTFVAVAVATDPFRQTNRLIDLATATAEEVAGKAPEIAQLGSDIASAGPISKLVEKGYTQLIL